MTTPEVVSLKDAVAAALRETGLDRFARTAEDAAVFDAAEVSGGEVAEFVQALGGHGYSATRREAGGWHVMIVEPAAQLNRREIRHELANLDNVITAARDATDTAATDGDLTGMIAEALSLGEQIAGRVRELAGIPAPEPAPAG